MNKITFSLSAVMNSKGWSHAQMTAEQRGLFAELAKSGKPNTLQAHSEIARRALIAGGATKAEASALVRMSLANLRNQLVKNPTRIPWQQDK